MATAATAQHPNHLFRSESDMLNTIPDPRSPSPAVPVASRHGSTSTDSGHHPDLSAEVATLSTKLVNAINHQTNLDDNLQATRHELDAANEHIRRLEEAARRREDEMQKGLWVKREDYEALRKERDHERKQRKISEAEKKKMESELESLTTALFEEANTMVAAARKETEASERKTDQLKSQLQDTELLLASQQEQLHDLKVVVEKISSERDENETNALSLTAPSTPGTAAHDKMARLMDVIGASPNTPGLDDVPPEHPLHYSHLITPVLRTDLVQYREFTELVKQGQIFSAPNSRASSGNYGNINVLGLAAQQLSNGSSTSLPTNPPGSAGSGGPISPRTSSQLPPLKECTFYKRVLQEDIEPTLRLDQAPGVSWMGRRTVINSIASGGLSVEPHPPIQKHRGPVFACALCGESRIADKYIRKWRFKTSEAEDAQRYPLCDWCVGRLRATCDYVGFLRMVQAGHWRADTEEEMKAAWEEAVRFRERMFWSRMGGGVVPAFLQKDALKSPTARPLERQSEDSTGSSNGERTIVDQKQEDPFKTEDLDAEKSASVNGGEETREDPAPTVEKSDVSVQITQERASTEAITPAEVPQPEAPEPVETPAAPTPAPASASPPAPKPIGTPPKKNALWDRIARFEKSQSPEPAAATAQVVSDASARKSQEDLTKKPSLEREGSSMSVNIPGAFS